MKAHPLSFCVLLSSAALLNALKVPVRQLRAPLVHGRKRSGHLSYTHPVVNAASDTNGTDELDMSTVHDLIYIANITLGGADYPVQLDTGSSDLWIKGPTSPLPNSQPTTVPCDLEYGIGFANGTIRYTSVEFAGIHVQTQAYCDVAAAENPVLSYGGYGIVGLGFDSLSTVDALVNHTGASTGRSLLYNAFYTNPNEPNYLAFSLQRSTDPDSDVEGTFTIGEVDPQYSAVLSSSPISTWPVSYPTRWNILIDAVIVGSKTVPVSSTVVGAPSGKAVVLLDSGTSFTYAPEDICNAIYGGVPGAHYDASIGQWVVPCDAEIDMALQIGGNIYAMHPLDVNPTSVSDPNTCTGSFLPQAVSVNHNEFDWLIGDNVLRSLYSIYDFGDFNASGKMGNPYVKLLSIVDPNEASAEFHKIRGGTPLTNITYKVSNNESPVGGAPTGGSTTVTLSDDLTNALNTIGKFMPAVLALVALNALVVLVLAIGGFVYFLRRRGKKVRARKTPGRAMTPMPMQNPPSSFDMGLGQGHTYEPVSMALTEDTFVPPSPAFSKDSSKLRPMSVA